MGVEWLVVSGGVGMYWDMYEVIALNIIVQVLPHATESCNDETIEKHSHRGIHKTNDVQRHFETR